MKKMKILVMAAHTDDGELGCGGTIAKSIAKGDRVFYVAFSAEDKNITDRHILKNELVTAIDVLGIQKNNIRVFDIPVREFPSCRQKILEKMIELKQEIDPDIVFLPSSSDCHQDHQVVCQEGFRAFKNITIFGYEVPWNNLSFTCNLFVVISEENLNKKMVALSKYKSQLYRQPELSEYIHHLAYVRGGQIKQKYAEAFEAIRIIIK